MNVQAEDRRIIKIAEKFLQDLHAKGYNIMRFLEEYRHIYRELGALHDQHQISDYDFTELKQLMEIVINHLAFGKIRIQKGIRDMGGKVLEFEHDILMKDSEARGIIKGEKRGEERGEQRGEKRGEAKALVKNVESIMKTLKLSLEKACEAMETTVGDYTKAKQMMLNKK